MIRYVWLLLSLMMSSMGVGSALAETEAVQGKGTHIDGRSYWYHEKLGNVRSFEARNDVVSVTIFGHHGPMPYWLSGEEMRNGVEKMRGYRDALLYWQEFLRSTLLHEQEIGVQKLQEQTGLNLSEPEGWLKWFDENGDFVTWDEAQDRYIIDEERKAKHWAEAIRGLRLTMRLDRSRYKVGEPIGITVRLENVHPYSGTLDTHLWVNGRLLWEADVAVELRTHAAHDVSYHRLRDLPPAPALTQEDFVYLDGQGAVEKSWELTTALANPRLSAGRYSLKVRYVHSDTGAAIGLRPNALSEQLPQRGPAWTGTLESLTEFFEVAPDPQIDTLSVR